MSRFLTIIILSVACAGTISAHAVAPYPEGGRAMVSSDHHLVSAAGADVLDAGGNAVDAAIAAALAAGVVQPAGSGLGGGGFAVVYFPDSPATVLDFREVAPAASTRDMYRTSDGGVNQAASRKGGLAVGIPGEGRGLAALLKTHGTLTLAQVAAPAIRLASKGFPLGAHLSGALGRTKDLDVRGLFSLDADPLHVGETVKRPALAKTLKRWAATGGDDLYTGAGAQAIVSAVAGSGGVLRSSDLQGYAPKTRAPIVGTYKGYTLVTMPPPSSGGVFLVQMLSVLEGFDLVAMGHNSADYVHVLSEAMKHAYSDRARHLGDPDFYDVPTEALMGQARVSEIQHSIYPGRSFEPSYYGELFEPPKDAGTQHISVVDANGAAVALTTTINTSFGSGLVVPELGIILNNEMDDFAAAPGVPNAYGLVGQEANAVAPGKRPLSSMTPTIVLDADGKVVMSIGASGGSFIITATLQTFLNIVEFGMDPQEAVAAPRFHHQWQPDLLFVEPGFSVDTQRALTARGHTLTERDGFSSCQVVLSADAQLTGGADPRKGGWPKGIW